jgi:hypothetical protein
MINDGVWKSSHAVMISRSGSQNHCMLITGLNAVSLQQPNHRRH